MEGIIKSFEKENRLLIKIKSMPTEDDAAYVVEKAISGLRELQDYSDIIFDVREYELSKVKFEYDYMRKFLLVMCLKTPRSIIRIGTTEFINMADEVIRALNVKLDSYIITGRSVESVQEKLCERGESFKDLSEWFGRFNFDLVENIDDVKKEDKLSLSEENGFDDPGISVSSVFVSGKQNPGEIINVKLEAYANSDRPLFFRYFYLKQGDLRNAGSYKFVGDYEWTKNNYCRFSIPSEGRYQFFAEVATDPSLFDKPNTPYISIPLSIQYPWEIMSSSEESCFIAGRVVDIVMLDSKLNKTVVKGKVINVDESLRIIDVLNLDRDLDFTEFKRKFVVSCVKCEKKGLFRHAFKARLVSIEQLFYKTGNIFKVYYEKDPKKVNLRDEYRYRLKDKDDISIYIYYKGKLISSGKMFIVEDISTGGFGIMSDMASGEKLSAMNIDENITTQIVLSSEDAAKASIISPKARLRWKKEFKNGHYVKMGFQFVDMDHNMKKDIQYYISLNML